MIMQFMNYLKYVFKNFLITQFLIECQIIFIMVSQQGFFNKEHIKIFNTLKY